MRLKEGVICYETELQNNFEGAINNLNNCYIHLHFIPRAGVLLCSHYLNTFSRYGSSYTLSPNFTHYLDKNAKVFTH